MTTWHNESVEENTVNEWEYKTCFLEMVEERPGSGRYSQSFMTDAQLTQLGSQGWELVSVIRLTTTGQGEITWGIQYIFKRPKR